MLRQACSDDPRVARGEMNAQVPALVVVGASAGGLTVLRRLLADLPDDLPASVLAVVHLPRHPQHPLAALVSDGCPLPIREAEQGEALQVGSVLVAPPDRHLELVPGGVGLSDAPPRNGVRPSVDVLFASAAQEFARKVVAVVLSGAMRDGAVGAATVERAGGRVLVQDPADALVTGMPTSALAATRVHEVAPAAGLAAEVRRLVDDVVSASA
jgi:two-component system chemotaxis response regulator CheB